MGREGKRGEERKGEERIGKERKGKKKRGEAKANWLFRWGRRKSTQSGLCPLVQEQTN